MIQHTPGPWQWVFRDRSVTLIHPQRGWLTVMDFVRLGMNGATFRLATWKGDERGNMGGIMKPAHEIDVNAHPDAMLIVAAPDLLAACKAAIDAAVEYGGRHGDYALCSQLDAAIRKATGASK